ncbi:MAG: hypothetical protein ACE5KM_14355 [Planctomycetaceae bacterium]
MPRTVTCQCGQRITVGPQSERLAVDCPSCGETVSLNGAGGPAALKFGVQFVDERNAVHTVSESRQIEFRCPGCERRFRDSHHAAGKRTRCPRCETEFVIPAATPGTPDGNAVSQSTPDATDRADAAVAAFGAARERRRFITPESMVPIGFALIALGGLVSILGSFLMVKGVMAAISMGGLGLGGSLERQKAADDAVRQMFGLREIEETAPRQLPEQRDGGQAMLIGGTIAGGGGMLMTFIGGIFLLAGLIGRFLQPALLSGIKKGPP